MDAENKIIKPLVFKIFDWIEEGFVAFYELLEKVFPGFAENYFALHETMIYIVYGFLLFFGVALAYRMRKKIFFIISLIAAMLIMAQYFL